MTPVLCSHRSDGQESLMAIPAFLRKRSRRNAVPLATSETYQTRAALWALRLLVNGKGYRFFINKDGFKDDDILRLIGLVSYSDEEVTLKEGPRVAAASLYSAGCRARAAAGRLHPH